MHIVQLTTLLCCRTLKFYAVSVLNVDEILRQICCQFLENVDEILFVSLFHYCYRLSYTLHSRQLPLVDRFPLFLYSAFSYAAEDAVLKYVEYCSLCCVADLVIESAGTVALAAYGVRAVGYVSYLAESLELYLDGLTVILIVRVLDQSDLHVLLKEVFSEEVIGSCDCEVDLIHDASSLSLDFLSVCFIS